MEYRFLTLFLLFSQSCAQERGFKTLLGQVIAENQALTERLAKLEASFNAEKTNNEMLRDQVAQMKEKLSDHQTRGTRSLNTTTIAFSAVITPRDVTNLNSGQPIIFDRSITNMGNAYDTSTGVFTAPVRGVYIFNMDIMVEPGENEYLQFVKDGAHVMYNYGHATGSLHDVSSSRTVVLELEMGNQSCAQERGFKTLLGQVIAENQALTERLAKLEANFNAEKKENEMLRHQVAEMKEKLSDHQTRVTRQLNTATIAFSAVITPRDVTNLNSGQPIIFDRSITNMGNAYDTSTGVFTAPVRGVYIFHMDIMVEPGQNEYLQFVKDGAHVMYNYGHATGSLDDVSSSRTVVLELEKGNQVWIRTSPNAGHGSGTIHGNEFSTFSGWLQAINE